MTPKKYRDTYYMVEWGSESPCTDRAGNSAGLTT